jgi:hypothetical protein
MRRFSVRELLSAMPAERRNVCLSIIGDFETSKERTLFGLSEYRSRLGRDETHLEKVMNVACYLYETLHSLRKLDFCLDRALFIIIVHDFAEVLGYGPRDGLTYAEKHGVSKLDVVRDELFYRYGHRPNAMEIDALKYIYWKTDKFDLMETCVQPALATFVICSRTLSTNLWQKMETPVLSDLLAESAASPDR